MLGTKRRIDPSVMQRLRDEPYRFEFFQAVRMLLARHRAASVESEQDVLGQVIRFRSSVSLAFPPSEIESLTFDAAPAAPGSGASDNTAGSGKALAFSGVTVTPSFIGLTGPLGVLPRHYTQHVAEREIYHRDKATRAFLDIFSTRAIALFYQTWLKYRLHLQYEANREHRFLPMVLSLAGLGLSGTRGRLSGSGEEGVADESLAYYAGAVRARPRSLQWFSRVVADYFGTGCRPEQFVGQWFVLPEHETSRLGTANCLLGETAFCGNRVWDRQSRVRLTVGPLRRQRFDQFLPGGSAAASLAKLFRLMVSSVLDCEVRLVLDPRDVPPAVLGRRNDVRLGWTAWIGASGACPATPEVAYLIPPVS